tara:strand:- start:145 stop:960 length:816 start_codon:yes stop_codon:yes gene_type:complete
MKNYLDPKFDYLLPLKTTCIRIGSKFDGGYIIRKEDINQIEKIVSFGMGQNHEDWSFEREFLKKKKVEVVFYDHSVSFHSYISNIFLNLRRFLKFRYKIKDLYKSIKNLIKYINFINLNEIIHHKKKICLRPKSYSEENPKNIIDNLNNNKILLKIDIEGSEYEIIDEILKCHDKIVCILLEFHNLNTFENTFEKKIKNLKTEFEIIHLHGNNYDGTLHTNLPITLEVTLVNKKYLKNLNINTYNYDFPVKGLDFPNNDQKPDLAFSFKKY